MEDNKFLPNDFEFVGLQGNCRYQGTIKEGNVENIFRISGNRYMVILDSGTETIRLQ